MYLGHPDVGVFQIKTYARNPYDVEVPLKLVAPDATGAGAEARMDRGVLTVELPKRESAPERTVPVEDA